MNITFISISIILLFACYEINAKKYAYFAYGSNMSLKRLNENIPNATQITIGKLNNYRLEFTGFSKKWNGSIATIVPSPNSHVWGVIWSINENDIKRLDRQEGVKKKIYFPKAVHVQIFSNILLKCRTYQKRKSKNPINNTPRKPSKAYIDTIIEGAKDYHLPKHYITYLESFKTPVKQPMKTPVKRPVKQSVKQPVKQAIGYSDVRKVIKLET